MEYCAIFLRTEGKKERPAPRFSISFTQEHHAMQTISVDDIHPIRRQTKAEKSLSGNKRTSPDNRSESETPDRNRVSQASHKIAPSERHTADNGWKVAANGADERRGSGEKPGLPYPQLQLQPAAWNPSDGAACRRSGRP